MVEGELEELLRQNLALAKDTNRLLHSMRRKAFWGSIFSFLWWIFLFIVIPAAIYYWYLAPYVNQALETYKQIQNGAKQVQGMKASFEANNPLTDAKKLYEQYVASHPASTQ